MGFYVAVVTGQGGQTASILDKDVCLKVYAKDLAEWDMTKEIAVELHPENGLRAVRNELSQIIAKLKEVHVLVAGDISGVAYNAFDAAGYFVFQIPQKSPEDFLNFVLASVEKQEEELNALKSGKSDASAIPSPQPAGEAGNYYLDIIQAQLDNPNATTKQMLKPFLEHTKFYELTIVCSHMPLWFDKEFGAMKLAYEKEALGPEKYKVIIHPAACE